MQNAVSENMAAFKITGQLHFINGQKWHAQIRRHGLNCAHPIARLGRNDFFFARDQCNGMVASFRRTRS